MQQRSTQDTSNHVISTPLYVQHGVNILLCICLHSTEFLRPYDEGYDFHNPHCFHSKRRACVHEHIHVIYCEAHKFGYLDALVRMNPHVPSKTRQTNMCGQGRLRFNMIHILIMGGMVGL